MALLLAVTIAWPTVVMRPRAGLAAISSRPSRTLTPPVLSTSEDDATYLKGFPYLSPDEVAEDIQYAGFGVNLRGREAYVRAAQKWQSKLPMRLQKFTVDSVTVLPPDARSLVAARYRVTFEAPVPLQVLPAQRARIANANLTRTSDGLVPVEARVAVSLEIERATGKVRRFSESLAVDPFAVTATIAHFELIYARRLIVLLLEAEGGQGDGSGVAWTTELTLRARAYWGALRELTRQELSEIVRRQSRESDELRVLGGDDGSVSDAEFERWFTGFVVKNFAIGGGFGAILYVAAKALREAL